MFSNNFSSIQSSKHSCEAFESSSRKIHWNPHLTKKNRLIERKTFEGSLITYIKVKYIETDLGVKNYEKQVLID